MSNEASTIIQGYLKRMQDEYENFNTVYNDLLTKLNLAQTEYTKQDSQFKKLLTDETNLVTIYSSSTRQNFDTEFEKVQSAAQAKILNISQVPEELDEFIKLANLDLEGVRNQLNEISQNVAAIKDEANAQIDSINRELPKVTEAGQKAIEDMNKVVNQVTASGQTLQQQINELDLRLSGIVNNQSNISKDITAIQETNKAIKASQEALLKLIDNTDDRIDQINQQIGDIVKIQTDIDTLKINKADKTFVDAQLAQIESYMEIEPESLRISDSETDGDLLQKAFTLGEGLNRNNVSIKLGRVYKVEKTIHLANTISYKKQPHLIVKGSGGGLELRHDGFMFDGVKNAGGVRFENVKFNGSTDFRHPFINGDNLIQFVFEGCQFSDTSTIAYANETDGYLQSYRFNGCNFKGMRTYQVIASMVYDMVISNNIIEWGSGGMLNLTTQSDMQYCSMGLFVYGNVVEGISSESPFKTTHNGNASFHDNYFEGNNYPDIDMSGGNLPHRSVTIRDNSFGNFPEVSGKTACVLVGKLYFNTGYDFSGNTGTKTIFDFTKYGGDSINLTGGRLLFSGQPSYVGIKESDIFHGNNKKPKAKVVLTGALKTFEFPVANISKEKLLSKTFLMDVKYNREGSTLYMLSYLGYIFFTTGWNVATSQVEIAVNFKPISHQNGESFNEEANTDSLKLAFKSSGTNRIKFDSKTAIVNDTITITTTFTGATTINNGSVIDFDNVIQN